MIARRRLHVLASGALTALALAACGEEGMSVDPRECPELIPYDINRPETWSDRVRSPRRTAERAGCITPIGTALTDPRRRSTSPSTGGQATTPPGDGGLPDAN
jgi:hypothetical protein